MGGTCIFLPGNRAQFGGFLAASAAKRLELFSTMAGQSQANLIVFRETRKRLATPTLLKELAVAVRRFALDAPNRALALDGLIRAGELECALADGGWAELNAVVALTDALADGFLGLSNPGAAESFLKLVQQAPLPQTLAASPPEGFAYYALHPADFAETADEFAPGAEAAVIGIRNIGTVLSAVFTAGLRRRGTTAQRITVRPQGHPYDRHLEFSAAQLGWIAGKNRSRARFFVVDEGPGLSGSSFLSVAEALVEAGVAAERIVLVGTRPFDPARLYARDAKRRCHSFQWKTVKPDFYARLNCGTAVGGGAWRAHFLGASEAWPACWPQMERLKFLAEDRGTIFKFEGLGRFGQEARERGRLLSQAGFAPAGSDAGNGLTAYRLLAGQSLRREDLSGAVLERLASYCAFRAAHFAAESESDGQLAQATVHNLAQELGLEVDLPAEALRARHAVISDSRMLPHEWVAGEKGELLKIDGCSHGDDHFLPGPTDIAWDLAGAIVEWNLAEDGAGCLASRFQQLTGDDPRDRLPAFVLAYAVFRLSYARMALLALQGSEEELRWREAYGFYRARVEAEAQGGRWSVRGKEKRA